MKRRCFRVTMVGVALAVVFILSGCSIQPDKVTQENYDRLKIGMKLEEVGEIMGPAQRSYPKLGMKQFTWVEGERHIHAKFVGGRAVYYSSKNLESSGSGTPARQSTPAH